MRDSRIIIVSLLLFLAQLGQAQERAISKAEEKYEQLEYIRAAEIYHEVAEKGFASEELLKKLANAFYFNAKYEEAAQYYAELFELQEQSDPLYFLRYAQSLKATGSLQEAEFYFDEYRKATSERPAEKGFEIGFLELLKENSGRYTIESLAINSSGTDFGAFAYGDQLYFASTRDTGVVRRSISLWDGLSFLDLYVVSANSENAETPQKLKGKVNSKLHESSLVLTSDGKTMYFAGNKRNSKEDSKLLSIYRAQLKNGKWKEVEELAINSPEYSNAHPSLNVEGNLMIFSSDRPGGFGQADLYSVEIFTDGSFGKPRNLGPEVNTLGRESFPFLTSDGNLYFSSDGHYGAGGLDVFYWDQEDALSKEPLNLGEPLNSPADDFAFFIDPETKKGYISSNREGGKGYDDIYAFTQHEPIRQLQHALVYGQVLDKETQAPLADAEVSLINSDNKKRQVLKTDAAGNYRFTAARFEPFFVRADKTAYYTDEKAGEGGKRQQEINFELERNIFLIYEGTELSRALGIENIYFDLDKSQIRPDAAVELQKVLAVMEKYPKVKIDIRSHTDSRASRTYNQGLSERRAKATVEYLVENGISPDRLTYEGVGEAEPVNQCADGTPCSEEVHQENRRSEFIIIQN